LRVRRLLAENIPYYIIEEQQVQVLGRGASQTWMLL